MPVASVILVEPSGAANVGAVLRVAANFGVASVDVVRPRVDLDDPAVTAWGCGGSEHLSIRTWDRFGTATAGHRLVVATVSGRGRCNLPVVGPAELARAIGDAGPSAVALVFGNETSGLPRSVIDRTDVAVRIPTNPEFPVLNLAQAVAILLGWLATSLPDTTHGPAPSDPLPATQEAVDGLMEHLRVTLVEIGFLDPSNPDRILRKLRRMLGRAAATTNEVDILRGICRQVLWAARRKPGRWSAGGGSEPHTR